MKRLRIWLRHELRRLEHDYGYECMEAEWGDRRRPNKALFYMRTFWHATCWYVSGFMCRWKGHDIVVEGYATPESGGDYVTCRRCGENWHHIYY